MYSYYVKTPDMPNNPLREGILPNGGAAHALVQALAERAANGDYWPSCQEEVKEKRAGDDHVAGFQC